MTTDAHDVQKEVRIYLAVFGGLLFFTIVTVSVSYLHLPLAKAITLALIIATIKAGLVACYFMHLISEKRLVYIVLSMTVIFFFGLLLLPLGNYHDGLVGTEHVTQSVSPHLH